MRREASVGTGAQKDWMCGRSLELEDSRYRLRGYKEALEEYGVEFDPELIYEGNYDRKSGMEAMEYFLSIPKKVTAVFAFKRYVCIWGI